MKTSCMLFGSSRTSQRQHIPVLLNEIYDIFNQTTAKKILDFTFGFGGHSSYLLSKSRDTEYFLCDRDPISYKYAQNLKENNHSSSIYPIKSKFSSIENHLLELNVRKNSIDFILMDLGFSSIQMDDESRGFSLSADATLDMRMSPDIDSLTAFDVVNYLEIAELSDILKKYGEIKEAKTIAKNLINYRLTIGPIKTTKQLADIVLHSVYNKHRQDSIGRFSHPATLVFQAFRIFVNDELNELQKGLEIALRYLTPETGRLAVISFHSLEDRIVKHQLFNKTLNGRDIEIIKRIYPNFKQDYYWQQVGDIITPTTEEILSNPRSRSAKLRVGRKIQTE